MVGKKSSMTQLKKKLSRLTNVNYTVSTLSQGRTQRWVLAWSFDPTIQLIAVGLIPFTLKTNLAWKQRRTEIDIEAKTSAKARETIDELV